MRRTSMDGQPLVDAAAGGAEAARPSWRGSLGSVLNRIRLRLWDCRISLISVLLGFMALLLLPRPGSSPRNQGLRSTIGFAMIVLVFWTIPVHNAAARAIQRSTGTCRRSGRSQSGRGRRSTRSLPRLLGGATLLRLLSRRGSERRSRWKRPMASPRSMPPSEAPSRSRSCMAGAAVVFVAYVVWRRPGAPPATAMPFLASLFRAMPTALGLFTFVVLAAGYLRSVRVRLAGRREGPPAAPPRRLGAALQLPRPPLQRTGWPLTIVRGHRLFALLSCSPTGSTTSGPSGAPHGRTPRPEARTSSPRQSFIGAADR